jgi:hypothetical protein
MAPKIKVASKRAAVIARAVAMLQSEGTLRDLRTMALNIDSLDDLSGLSVTEAEVNEILGIAPAAPTRDGLPQDTIAPETMNDAPVVNVSAAPVEKAIESPMTPAAAHANLVAAERDLHDKQSRVEVLSRELRAKRAAAAAAIQAWQISSGRVVTQEQQARQYIASENARRAAGIKDRGREIILGPGACAIDQMAAATAGGGMNARRGGGNAFRRGATTVRGTRQ